MGLIYIWGTVKALEIRGSCRGSEEDREGVDREVKGEPRENAAWKAEEENPKGQWLVMPNDAGRPRRPKMNKKV